VRVHAELWGLPENLLVQKGAQGDLSEDSCKDPQPRRYLFAKIVYAGYPPAGGTGSADLQGNRASRLIELKNNNGVMKI